MQKSNRTDTDPRYHKLDDLSVSLLDAQKTVAQIEIHGTKKKSQQTSLNRSFEQYQQHFNRHVKN